MQAFARSYVLITVTTAVACVTVKKVTKVANVKSQQENVKCPVAQDMDDALKVNAIVNAASKDTTARNVSCSLFLSIYISLTLGIFQPRFEFT